VKNLLLNACLMPVLRPNRADFCIHEFQRLAFEMCKFQKC
jgi:hypothetical protein